MAQKGQKLEMGGNPVGVVELGTNPLHSAADALVFGEPVAAATMASPPTAGGQALVVEGNPLAKADALGKPAQPVRGELDLDDAVDLDEVGYESPDASVGAAEFFFHLDANGKPGSREGEQGAAKESFLRSKSWVYWTALIALFVIVLGGAIAIGMVVSQNYGSEYDPNENENYVHPPLKTVEITHTVVMPISRDGYLTLKPVLHEAYANQIGCRFAEMDSCTVISTASSSRRSMNSTAVTFESVVSEDHPAYASAEEKAGSITATALVSSAQTVAEDMIERAKRNDDMDKDNTGQYEEGKTGMLPIYKDGEVTRYPLDIAKLTELLPDPSEVQVTAPAAIASTQDLVPEQAAATNSTGDGSTQDGTAPAICNPCVFTNTSELKESVKSYCENKLNYTGDSSIGNWDVSGVTDMSEVFKNCKKDIPISNWDVSSVTDMHGMFWGAETFDEDISGWVVSKVTRMSEMFRGAKKFNKGLGKWKVNAVTDMQDMFYMAHAFNQNINDWMVNAVTNMRLMFHQAKAFNQPLGKWQVNAVTDMDGMFSNATTFNQDISRWTVDSVTIMRRMFYGATAFNQEGKFNAWKKPADTINIQEMFVDSGMDPPSGWNTDPKSSWPWVHWSEEFKWVAAALTALAAVIVVSVVVSIAYQTPEPTKAPTAAPTPGETSAPTTQLEGTWSNIESGFNQGVENTGKALGSIWDSIKAVFVKTTGVGSDQVSVPRVETSSEGGSRRSEGGLRRSAQMVQFHLKNPSEAQMVLTALSSTSGSTFTQMLVQELRATNYTGPMPTMVTSVVHHISDGSSSSDGSTDNMTLVIVLVVAGALLLLAVALIGALMYMYNRAAKKNLTNSQRTRASNLQLTPSAVGIQVNPVNQ